MKFSQLSLSTYFHINSTKLVKEASPLSGFTRPYKIRFEDCDPAGIVFYPRYILMLHRFFEDWFDEGLGNSLGTINVDRKIGFPVVDLQVRFQKPSRLEETLDWSLAVARISSKALTLKINAACNGERRLSIEITVVAVDLATNDIVSREIPADMHDQMSKFLIVKNTH